MDLMHLELFRLVLIIQVKFHKQDFTTSEEVIYQELFSQDYLTRLKLLNLVRKTNLELSKQVKRMDLWFIKMVLQTHQELFSQDYLTRLKLLKLVYQIHLEFFKLELVTNLTLINLEQDFTTSEEILLQLLKVDQKTILMLIKKEYLCNLEFFNQELIMEALLIKMDI